jgi:hypothetical protein
LPHFSGVYLFDGRERESDRNIVGFHTVATGNTIVFAYVTKEKEHRQYDLLIYHYIYYVLSISFIKHCSWDIQCDNIVSFLKQLRMDLNKKLE